MTKYSWAGGSREKEKIAFKKYKNVIGAFFKVICLADLQFSEVATLNFFKSIIENTKRRAMLTDSPAEKRRSSTGKNRPSRLTYKKKDDLTSGAHTDDINNNDKENHQDNTE